MRTITIQARSLVWFIAGVVFSLIATVVVTNSWRADAIGGDFDATFVPIAPCRLIDTRESGQLAWGPDVTRPLDVHGHNGDCFVAGDAIAVSMNVTAVRATDPTFLTIWPADNPMPNASSLNPVPGQPPTPNAVTTELSPTGTFKVYNLAGSVHVIIDINGYYTPTSLKEIEQRIDRVIESTSHAKIDADSTGAWILRSSGVTGVSRLVPGVYQVDFSDPIQSCAWFATMNANQDAVAPAGEVTVELASASDSDSLWVRTHNSAGVEVDPGDDAGFSVHVIC